MKRFGAILCLSLSIVLMATTFSFASGFTLDRDKSYPEEGYDQLTPQNVAIKLVFSEKISDPISIAANKDCFTLTDAEGKVVNFELLYDEEKYPNEVWIQVAETLTQNMGYKVIIDEGMQSSAGNTLDESVTLNFSTRNTEADSTGYMILMALMMVGMIGFTVIDTKRKMKKESGQNEDDQRVNPYKEAKRTGKSVEEVVARTEKEKAQAERRKARIANRQSSRLKGDEEPIRPGYKRVKRARTISETGRKTPQSFIDERNAREARKAKAKAAAQQPQTRSRGSKQQQRKKK